MRQRARTVGTTVAIAAITGIVMAGIIVLDAAPRDTIRYSLTTWTGLANLLFIACIATLPVTVSTGVVAGLIVYRAIVRDERRRSVTSWVAAGCGYGIAIGVAGTFAWFAGFSVIVGAWPPPALFVMTGILAAVGGAIAGSVVGVYARREAHRSSGAH